MSEMDKVSATWKLKISADSGYSADSSGRCSAKQYGEAVSALNGNNSQEIERLNAQVAMLRVTFENIRDGLYIKSFPNSDEIEMTKSVIKNAIGFTESDWLAAHDVKVRDDALEEVATECERTKMYKGARQESYVYNDVWDAAKGIRAMKSAK